MSVARIGVSVACILAFPGGAPASSDDLPAIAPGARVRVTAPQIDAEPLVGTLLEIQSEGLCLELPGHDEPRLVPRSAVRKVEVSRGRTSRAGQGALMGLAVGGAVTMLLTFGDYSSDVHGDLNLLVIGAGLAAGGAAIGGGIGWAIKTDQWEDARPQEVRVELGPVRGSGLGVSLSLAWTGRPIAGR